MKLSFFDFIPDCQELSAEKVREFGFVSRILPELPSSDEIRGVIEITDISDAALWSYEFGSAPQENSMTKYPDVVTAYERENYLNVFMKFGSSLFIWVPEHHEYFVIFGKEKEIEKISKSELFDYEFSDYLLESFHSQRSRASLKRAWQLYDSSNTSKLLPNGS